MAYNDGLQKLRQTTLIQFKPNSQKITALQSFQLGLESTEKCAKKVNILRSLVKAEYWKAVPPFCTHSSSKSNGPSTRAGRATVNEPALQELCCEMRKNVFNRALSGCENVELKQAEVKTTSHCGIKNCKRCQVEVVVALPCVSHLNFHLQKTGGIDFSQLPDPMQGVILCPLDISRIFFLSRSVVNFGQHGTSNSWQKPEIDASFQLMSHLTFIVLLFHV